MDRPCLPDHGEVCIVHSCYNITEMVFTARTFRLLVNDVRCFDYERNEFLFVNITAMDMAGESFWDVFQILIQDVYESPYKFDFVGDWFLSVSITHVLHDCSVHVCVQDARKPSFFSLHHTKGNLYGRPTHDSKFKNA